MKLPRPHTLKEIADLLRLPTVGDDDHLIYGINEIHVVSDGDVVFVDHPKYYDKALNSAATTIIIDKEVAPPEGKALILSKEPFDTFNALIAHFSPRQAWAEPGTKIDPSARVAKNVVMGKNVSIGANTTIHPGVVIYDNVEIGREVEIHANSVIGSHGFYYKNRGESYDKLLSAGGVVIEDHVEIGAGSTIDKGVTGLTRIGAHTKIDNLVHVGHDTTIGKHCLIAAQVGIAGTVKIEDNVTLWGQVGVRSDIVIGEGAVVLAQTGISKSIGAGKTYFGSPVAESREKLKEMANTRRIPFILDELNRLKDALKKD